MKVSIELALRTREVYQLFERRINGDRLFIEAILHKFNIVMNQCRQQNPQAHAIYQQIHQDIVKITRHFTDEVTHFDALIAKKKDFSNTKVNYITQFRPVIIATNPLSMHLIEFIEIYDKLIAGLKLLQITGCFESDSVYWSNNKHYQKMANQMLSTVILTPTTLRPIIKSHDFEAIELINS
jgi:hypothetical protein